MFSAGIADRSMSPGQQPYCTPYVRALIEVACICRRWGVGVSNKAFSCAQYFKPLSLAL